MIFPPLAETSSAYRKVTGAGADDIDRPVYRQRRHVLHAPARLSADDALLRHRHENLASGALRQPRCGNLHILPAGDVGARNPAQLCNIHFELERGKIS